MSQKRFLLASAVLLILFVGLPHSAYCQTAIMLSDAELDNIYVGGFEFNLNAAYAFRSAVISQFNISAVACANNSSSNNISIDGANHAVLMSSGDSAVTNQSNVSTVFAKNSDIINSVINNLNSAHVSNVVTNADAGNINSPSVETPVTTPAPGVVAGGDALSLNSAENNSETGSGGQTSPLSPETPDISLKTSGVSASSSAVVTQTNVAALVALNGNIGNAKITNSNLADIENQGNSALAVQTNIAVVIAKGAIENMDIKNSNIANVMNDNTVANGYASVSPIYWKGTLANFQVADIIVHNQAAAAQMDITFVTSLGDKIKNSVSDILSRRVVNVH